jgi:hypothetical protein
MARDDFNTDTKDELAKRVGVRCSNPECRKTTSGPRHDPTKSINIGVAAHICAASNGGPRYQREMPTAQRASIYNGIWLCQNCAKMVDNDVSRYSVCVMRKWKEDAELAARNALEGSAAKAHIEESLVTSPYQPEAEHEERDFFGPIFNQWPTTSGHFDMIVRPVVYRVDRIELHHVPRKIVEYAAIIDRSGILDAVPFEENHDQENFVTGARLRLFKPEWRLVEAVSLHSSGNYRIVRAFQEDYEPSQDRTSARLVEINRTLLIDSFVEQMTLLHVLARNIARDLLADPDEEVQIDLRVDGFAGRTLAANRLDRLQAFLIGVPGHTGTENVFKFSLRTTLRALEVEAVSIARDRCARVLWTFGLRGDAVPPMQRALLGGTEPIALPLP